MFFCFFFRNYLLGFVFQIKEGNNNKQFANNLQKYLNISHNIKTKQTSSKLNNTPPMGAPKATDTPAAADAERTYKEIITGCYFFKIKLYDLSYRRHSGQPPLKKGV